jgi:hypothetical protein
VISATYAMDLFCSVILSRYGDWLRAGQPRGQSLSPNRDTNFHFSMSSRPVLGVYIASYPMSTGGVFPGGKTA